MLCRHKNKKAMYFVRACVIAYTESKKLFFLCWKLKSEHLVRSVCACVCVRQIPCSAIPHTLHHIKRLFLDERRNFNIRQRIWLFGELNTIIRARFSIWSGFTPFIFYMYAEKKVVRMDNFGKWWWGDMKPIYQYYQHMDQTKGARTAIQSACFRTLRFFFLFFTSALVLYFYIFCSLCLFFPHIRFFHYLYKYSILWTTYFMPFVLFYYFTADSCKKRRACALIVVLNDAQTQLMNPYLPCVRKM
jgi:hypothetical protein